MSGTSWGAHNNTLYIINNSKQKAGGTKSIPMTKEDAGGMSDAILDTWKTGVEYWGYTWSSSFSMPGTITYIHSCVW